MFNVAGAMRISMGQTGPNWSGSGFIDLSSLGLGVMPGTATGTQSGSTITFTFTATSVGNGSGTITNGDAVGTGTEGPPLAFGPFTFTGVLTPTAMVGHFLFTNPGGGGGNAALANITSPTLPSSWGAVKNHYR